MVASYGAYTLLMKANLTREFPPPTQAGPMSEVTDIPAASIVFSSMVVFDLLRDQLKLVSRFTPLVVKGTVFLVLFIIVPKSHVVLAKVSLDRVNAFLHDVCGSVQYRAL